MPDPADLEELIRVIQARFPDRGRIDSTENRGPRAGVGSVALDGTKMTQGYVLTATGAGGSTWQPGSASLPPLIAAHIGDDLVGWWRMGDASGNLADSSQNPAGAKDLLKTAGTTPSTYDVTGGLSVGDDGAHQFNYNETAEFPTNATIFSDTYLQSDAAHRWRFIGTLPFTAELLFKPTSGWSLPANLAGFFGTTNSDGLTSPTLGVGWGFLLDYTYGLQFHRMGDYVQKTGALTADTWYHLAATYDGTTLKLYVNGVLAASAASSTSIAATGANIDDLKAGYAIHGGAGAGTTVRRYIYGTLDECAIYNTALTAAEILEHASAGISITSPSSGDLVIYNNGS